MADIRIVSGPEPIQTYTVCNHDALFRVNDRAVRLRSGGPSFIDNGSTFVVGWTPSVYLESKRLIRHSYRSLSASGVCE